MIAATDSGGGAALDARAAWKELDLDALESNVAAVRERAGGHRRLIASVKANAYGHGVAEVGRRLAAIGVDALATGSPADARALRRAGVGGDVLLFAGPAPAALPALIGEGFVPTVHDAATAEAAATADVARPARVWVKVDCGLGRVGVALAEAADFVRALAARPRVAIEGLYTHVPFHDAEGVEWSRRRIAEFEALVAALGNAGVRPPITQATASAHLAAGMADGCTAVCPGHLLYGISPLADGVGDVAAFRPVLRAVRARLVQVTHHREAHTFGVGGRHPLPAGTVTGVVPFGLGDGHRGAAAGARAIALANGRRAPVLGVSLEHTTLDLTGAGEVGAGDVVTFVGADGDDAIGLEEAAATQGAAPIEMLTRLSALPVRALP